MDIERLRDLLVSLQAGDTSVDQAVAQLKNLPFEDLGYAQIDLHRSLRTGNPEVVFCQSKTVDQVAGIFDRLSRYHADVLGTRATAEQFQGVQALLTEAEYDPVSRLIALKRSPPIVHPENSPYILVACAGTADLPVAEEAAQTAEFLGSRVIRAFDVGVAGIHRLLSKLDLLQNADVIISVAGMEGALTSVIGGLAACPVVGVPTSIGYGASFDGVAALLAMLNSCASGVAVVNIDNGFGAGLYAHTILKRIKQPEQL
jgi:NCAIR mutase (PurE)-related protein